MQGSRQCRADYNQSVVAIFRGTIQDLMWVYPRSSVIALYTTYTINVEEQYGGTHKVNIHMVIQKKTSTTIRGKKMASFRRPSSRPSSHSEIHSILLARGRPGGSGGGLSCRVVLSLRYGRSFLPGMRRSHVLLPRGFWEKLPS